MDGCSRLQVITSSPGLRPRPLTTMLIPSVVFCWSVISWGVALIRPDRARRTARKISSRSWFAGGAVGPADSMAKVSWTAAMTERGQGPCQPVLRYVSEAGAWRAATAALYFRTKRDFRRAAALAWTTPFLAARSSLLRAARTAKRAASGSPAAMAASAFFTIVLVALRTMRLRRRRFRD